ncbi:MAG: hypothetical protein LAT81_12885 [Oceanicaulis sp.]|nr:hypothetical protein [Oceanicaulis sp.]
MRLIFFSFFFLMFFNGNSQAIYCQGGPLIGYGSEIETVQLFGETANINYTQICPGISGINNQTTNQSANLIFGGTYSLSIVFGNCDFNYYSD